MSETLDDYESVISTQMGIYHSLRTRRPEMAEDDVLNKLITSRIASWPSAAPDEQEHYDPLLGNPDKTLEDVIWAIVEYEFILSRAEEAVTMGKSLGLTTEQIAGHLRDFEENARNIIREGIREETKTRGNL